MDDSVQTDDSSQNTNNILTDEYKFSIEKPNYTQIPNILFDEWLPLLKGGELKVLLAIYRHTFGYHVDEKRLSISMLQELTGSNRTELVKNLKSLAEKNLIVRETEVVGNNNASIIRVVTRVNLVRKPYYPSEETVLGASAETVLGSTPTPYIERKIRKKTINKCSSFTPTATALALVDSFKTSLLKIKPDMKLPSDDMAWLKEMDAMLRLDNRIEEEIAAIIDWLPDSAFWRKNILSVGKLRKQFDKLALECSEYDSRQNPTIGTESVKDFLDEIKPILIEGQSFEAFSTYLEAHDKDRPFTKFFYKAPSFKVDVLKYFSIREKTV